MIKIPQPSLAVNAIDAPQPYKMERTLDISSEDTIGLLTAKIFVHAEKQNMKCLVINCHSDEFETSGGFGFALGEGITNSNVNLFHPLKGFFKCIIINACEAAKYTYTGGSFEGNGRRLCSELAKITDSYVIAPTKTQYSTWSFQGDPPTNHIDNFEGPVLLINPSGGLDRKSLLGRRLIKKVFSD